MQSPQWIESENGISDVIAHNDSLTELYGKWEVVFKNAVAWSASMEWLQGLV